MAAFGTILLEVLLLLSAWAGALAFVGAHRRSAAMVLAAERATYAAAFISSAAVGVLAHAFAVSNFSIMYVQHYSDRSMPLFYKLTAVWGGQQGSLLFWAWLLAVMSAWAIRVNREQLRSLLPHAIALLMGVLVFFCLMLLLVADPFETFLTAVPQDGRGLNPLLQNAYMVTHPPALYIGYVGMAIPFAFALASLLAGRDDEDWIRAARPWALGSWYFLTLGLVLGMTWAYEELGWGGYWAWDPVENAGLIPWLTATAFLHSVMLQERRQLLKVWNVVLAVLTFELTIFGTFLTRSGLIQSVHAFARSSIGFYFLAFMGLVAVLAGGIIYKRRGLLRSGRASESMLSREFAFEINNWLLTAASLLVIVLTLFPTLSQLTGNQITINAAAFNRWMVPVGLALLLLKGVGILISWRRSTAEGLRRQFSVPLAAFALTLGALAALGARGALPLLTFGLAAFVLAAVALELGRSVLARRRAQDEGLGAALAELLRRNRRRYGGHLVHAGVALMFIGFGGEAYKTDKELQLQVGQRVEVDSYTLRYDGTRITSDQQKEMATATLSLYQRGERLGSLTPARWVYFKHQGQPTSEVDVRRSLREDLFVALGSFDPAGGAATFKIVINPLVNWIWIGFVLLSVGALVSFSTVWQRRARRAEAALQPRSGRDPERLMEALRYVLPLALGATGGVIQLVAGQGGLELVLVVLIGALLGWSMVLALESAMALGGFLRPREGLSGAKAEELAGQREQALAAICEIELDAELEKLAAAEAALLAAPLRQQASQLQATLEELRLRGPRSLELEIEAEVARRLAAKEAP